MSATVTDILKLNQWTGNEYPKRVDFVGDNKKIDDFAKFQNIPVEEITFNANVYEAVNSNYTPADYYNGMTLKLIGIPADSTGPISINYNNLGAITLLKKAKGNAASNFKSGGVYLVTYINGNFILASGSDESDSTSVGTDGSKVLEGETFIGSDGEIHTGQIPIQNSVNSNLNCGQSISLPAGYYGAESKITGNSLASQTPSNADASKIVSGYHAWINGQDVWGNATIQSLGGMKVFSGRLTKPVGGYLSYDLGFTPTIFISKEGNYGWEAYALYYTLPNIGHKEFTIVKTSSTWRNDNFTWQINGSIITHPYQNSGSNDYYFDIIAVG